MKHKKFKALALVTTLIVLAMCLSGCNVVRDSVMQFRQNTVGDVTTENGGWEIIDETIDSITEQDDEDATPQNDTQKPPAELAPVDGTTELMVRFIDVGQGDSILLSCDGHYMLVDGGERSESDKMYSIMEKEGITHLDYMVATHAHSDHIGGLSGAATYATVGQFFTPVTEYDSVTFKKLYEKMQRESTVVVPNPGDSFMLGDATVSVLGPVKDYEETNDTSIVLKVQYGEHSFLLTGDMEEEAEKDMMNSGADVSATVLKVGHHGSNTSTCYQFLKAVAPEYAVIQVGTGNEYGHPTENTLSRLRDADVEVYRNDLDGDIEMVSDGTNLSIACIKVG